MIESLVYEALRTRMAGWTECKIVQPDEVYTPVATTPFIIAQFVSLDTDNAPVGWRCGDEYRGILNMSVCAPVLWTMTQHLGLANRIMAFIPGGSQYSYSGVSVNIYQNPRVIRGSRLDNAHNRLEVEIPWRSWFVPPV